MPKQAVRKLFCMVFLLWGCAQPIVASDTVNGVTCTLEFAMPLVANASIPVTVRFMQDGQTVELTDVSLDLQMPGMTMGTNRPLAQPQADGSHTTAVLFTMDGEWAVIVTGRSGTQEQRFVIENIIVSP